MTCVCRYCTTTHLSYKAEIEDMHELVRAALTELRDHGYITEPLLRRMTPEQISLALNLAGA